MNGDDKRAPPQHHGQVVDLGLADGHTHLRAGLDTDAGGDYDEENAVCYLQILLADELPGFGRARMMADMDAWGYSFRLGSARSWFEEDAEDARSWLQRHGLIDASGRPTFALRTDAE